jgi:FKBP-type peptidyl-prolyl cis-trans isomerase FklB
MKSSILSFVGLTVVLAAAASGQAPRPKAAAPVELKDNKAKASYGIGFSIGNQLKTQGLKVDPTLVARGLADCLSGGDPAVSEQELRQALEAFGREMSAQKQQSDKVAGERNMKEGVAFLAANRAKPGVVTLPSGLQYQVLKQGTGPTPKPTDEVFLNYRGTLLDGTEFDSSYKTGQPAKFPVGRVIPGFSEALKLMKTGSRWKIFIPSELGYRDSSPPGSKIGPNSVLTFDVDLIKIAP